MEGGGWEMRVVACALGTEPGPLTPPLRKPSGATAATKTFPVNACKRTGGDGTGVGDIPSVPRAPGGCDDGCCLESPHACDTPVPMQRHRGSHTALPPTCSQSLSTDPSFSALF